MLLLFISIKYAIVPLVASGLISAGASILSPVINNMIQNRNVNKQNEFNSPANQMKRFAQAGLNPNLIYSQGNPGNMSSAAYNSPTPEVDFGKGISGMMNMLSTYQSLKQSQAGILNTNADTAIKAKQGNLIDSQIEKTQADTANAITQNSLIQSQTTLNNLNAFALDKRNSYQDRMLAAELAGKLIWNNYQTAQTENAKYQRNVWNAQIANYGAQTSNLNQQTTRSASLLPWDVGNAAGTNTNIGLKNADQALQNLITGSKSKMWENYYDPSNFTDRFVTRLRNNTPSWLWNK